MNKIKKILSIVFNEFIYGGHLQCLGALSIIIASSIFLDLKITWDVLIVIYLISYSLYLYNRFKEINIDFTDNIQRTIYLRKYVEHIPIMLYFIIVFSLVYSMQFSNKKSLIFVSLFLIFGLLYTAVFKKMTKYIFFFKNIYVAIFHSLLIPFLILYYSYYSVNYYFLYFLMIYIFFRAFFMQILLDVKDIKSDSERNLKTLPALIGKENTLKFLYFASLLFTIILPIIFSIFYNFLFQTILIILPIFLFNIYCYQLVKKNKYIGYVYQSGEFILWLVMIMLSNYIW